MDKQFSRFGKNDDIKPVVSIIIPVFNAERYLSSAIESVLSQTFKNWELIAVDDSSSDKSLSILNEYLSCDKRIRVLTLDHNSGAAVARNAAIEKAIGRYLAFLDSDDQWLPEKLEKQLMFMQQHDYAFTYSGYYKIKGDGLIGDEIVIPPSTLGYKDLLKSNQIGCLTVMYDTSQLGKVYMPLIRARQDYALWLRLLKSIDKAYGLCEPLALYRSGGNSLSSNKIKMIKYNWRVFRECERLSLIRSTYYLAWNVYRKLFA